MQLLLKALTAFAVSCVVILGGPGVASAATNTDVLDVAHRGASGTAPENTIAAVKAALAQHASYVEVDVQRSKDGELIMMHDTTLARTTDVEEVFPDRSPWKVGDFTMEELSRLDAGSWFSSRFAGEPIPTLEDVVEALDLKAGLLLEFKAPELYPGIEKEIYEEFSSFPGYLSSVLAADKLVVQSFNHESMRTFYGLDPEIPVGLLMGYRPSETELAAASEWAEQINPSYRVTDEALVEDVQRHGMTINVYTLNSGQLMRQYIDMGVDGIITDYPAVLRDILRERS